MQRYKRYSVWLLVICMLFAMLPAYATGGLNSRLNDAKSKLQQEQKNMNQYKNQQAALQNEIATLDTKINNYEHAIADLSMQIVEKEASIAQKEQEIEYAQAQCDVQTESFKTRARVSYENGISNYLLVLLGSASFSEFISNMETIAAIVKYDNSVLGSLKENKAYIETLKSEIELEKQALIDTKNQQQTWMQECETLRGQKQSEYNEATENLENAQQAVNAQQQQVNQLQQQANARTQSTTTSTPKANTVYKGGTLAWPTPSCYTITSYFGMREHPIYGDQRYHSGIDIGAAYGAKIVAAENGTVMTAARSSSYGNMIVVQHDNGLTTLYAHLSQINVSVNQRVTRGQTIGLVGSTGNSTGPHLHFEVSNGSSRLNPLDYLK